jgi:hypothetical protein
MLCKVYYGQTKFKFWIFYDFFVILHQAFGSRLNVEIMTTFMRSAAYNKSPREMAAYLAIVKAEGITPNSRMVDVVERFYQKYRSWILTKETGGHVPYPVVLEMRADLPNWRAFSASYRDWLGRTAVDDLAAGSPWDQYKISKDVEREERTAARRKER